MSDSRKEANYQGLISWSRISYGARVPLFGTDIKSDHTIEVKISKASLERSLSEDHFLDDGQIISVELSPIQWAEFLTNGNFSSGIPCTIKKVEGKKMDEVENTSVSEKFDKETKETFDDFQKSLEEIEKILKDKVDSNKPLGIKEMKELLHTVEVKKSNTVANVSYIRNAFKETIKNDVVKAKAEISAFCENKALELGFKELKNNSDLLIESKEGKNE